MTANPVTENSDAAQVGPPPPFDPELRPALDALAAGGRPAYPLDHIPLIRSGIERLADALEDCDPAQRGRVASIGMPAGHGAPWPLQMSLRALEAEDTGWAMQYLDNAHRAYAHPAAMGC